MHILDFPQLLGLNSKLIGINVELTLGLLLVFKKYYYITHAMSVENIHVSELIIDEEEDTINIYVEDAFRTRQR